MARSVNCLQRNCSAAGVESPNKAAEPYIDKVITSNPLIYPSAAELAKLPFQKDLGEKELAYSDRWDKVKTA